MAKLLLHCDEYTAHSTLKWFHFTFSFFRALSRTSHWQKINLESHSHTHTHTRLKTVLVTDVISYFSVFLTPPSISSLKLPFQSRLHLYKSISNPFWVYVMKLWYSTEPWLHTTPCVKKSQEAFPPTILCWNIVIHGDRNVNFIQNIAIEW